MSIPKPNKTPLAPCGQSHHHNVNGAAYSPWGLLHHQVRHSWRCPCLLWQCHVWVQNENLILRNLHHKVQMFLRKKKKSVSWLTGCSNPSSEGEPKESFLDLRNNEVLWLIKWPQSMFRGLTRGRPSLKQHRNKRLGRERGESLLVWVPSWPGSC